MGKILDLSGKGILNLLLVALAASVLYMALGWLNEKVLTWGTWGSVLTIAIVAVYFWYGAKLNKGKETIGNSLPKALIVIAIIGALAIIWPDSPLVFGDGSVTFVSLASVFGSVFLGNVVASKIM